MEVASNGFDILFCSETLVSNFRHISELAIPGFKRPILFKRNEINRAQGMAVYIRSGCSASHKATFECGCHEVQIIKVCGKHGVLRKLKHIFPNTYQRMKSIRSPAKGGTGCYRFNYQPGS